VGGSKTSAHRFARAADFTVEDVSNIEVCRKLAELVPHFDQIIYEFGPDGWVHLGLTNGKPRGQLLTAIKRKGKTVYLPGIVEQTV
jgi:zinc D-Ala-D-Ala carboxypeptidase